MLSPRQIEILSMIASGLEKEQIAYFLGISLHTVDEHTRRAFLKLGACTSAQAVYLAITSGVPLVSYNLSVTQIRNSTN
jgi:DNA-binding NarL/FixJ family response regulator